MKANQAALEAGQLAERLASGYYAHTAALQVAMQPAAVALAPSKLPGHVVPIGFVQRKDGTSHAFDFTHFLRSVAKDPEIAGELPRIWLTGSLLAVGDRLSKHKYFDRAPELELLRHLRNGIAHGNRFNILYPKELTDFPAHNRLAWISGDNKNVFEIQPALDGQPVLFDFMGPGDVLDLLMSVGLYLIRMGNGDSLRPS